MNPLFSAVTNASLIGAVALTLSTDEPRAHVLLQRGSASAPTFTLADALSDGSPAIRQDPESLQQTTDTLGILLERIRTLETAGDSAQAGIADLQLAVAGAIDEIARERGARADAMGELLRSLLLLMDSTAISVASDAQTRLEEHLGSVRADSERNHATVRAQADSIVRELGNLGIRIDAQEANFNDSLSISMGRIQEERQQRQFGDQRNRFLLGLASGLLLIAVVAAWRHIARNVDAVRGMSVANAERTQHRLLRDHLRPLEELSSMLGTIRTAIEDAHKHRDSETNHDLPLKICNEVNRIEKNLRAMDPLIRGHKKLAGCVRRVKNNLRAHDYEVAELVGRPYDVGMLLEADFVEDHKLTQGQEVITQINRPEVRYRGKIIQAASVTVSVGL